MPGSTIRVYLAGPDVFAPNAKDIGLFKRQVCEMYGLTGLYPLDNEIVATEDSDVSLDRLIYCGNIAMMRECDCAILNLSPFRGPGADDGTAFELGFLTALGKPCFGHITDPRSYRDRVASHVALRYDEARGAWIDPANNSVEDFGNAHNLMIDNALRDSGHPINTQGFGTCIQQVLMHYGMPLNRKRILRHTGLMKS